MTSKPPLVSAVIPAYNAERTIAVAMESVLNQTFNDLELIVVDDGSTDSTRDLAGASGDGRVRVLSKQNAGHAAARNTGIAAARGRYVGFLDADDMWLPEKLNRQLGWFAERPDGYALQTGVFRVDDDLNVLAERRCVDWADPLLDILSFRNLPGLMSTLLVDRTTLIEVGCFDPSLRILQDWDLAIRLALAGRPLHSLESALAAYRTHADNQSHNVEIQVDPGFRVLAKVFADPRMPDRIKHRRRHVYARLYTMLCGGEVQARNWRGASRWGMRAIAADPRTLGYMVAMPRRRTERAPSSEAPTRIELGRGSTRLSPAAFE